MTFFVVKASARWKTIFGSIRSMKKAEAGWIQLKPTRIQRKRRGFQRKQHKNSTKNAKYSMKTGGQSMNLYFQIFNAAAGRSTIPFQIRSVVLLNVGMKQHSKFQKSNWGVNKLKSLSHRKENIEKKLPLPMLEPWEEAIEAVRRQEDLKAKS